MKYPKKFQVLLAKCLITDGMSLGKYWKHYDCLLPVAESLVKERIKGNRKGLESEPNYMHSFRVRDKVSKLHHWDDPDLELFLAALLHDIVEDGHTSFEELAELGFSRRTVELVYLCTHDKRIKNHTERWIKMIARLIEADDDEAWIIKMVDLADNIQQSRGLSRENRKFMLEAKAPIVLRVTKDRPFLFSGQYRGHLADSLDMAKNPSKKRDDWML